MTILQAIEQVEKATSSTFFKKDVDHKAYYHTYAKLLHPDTCPPGDPLCARAEAAFKKLNTMYAAISIKETANEIVIGQWVVAEKLAEGDIADIYRANKIGIPEDVQLKISKSEADNDLLEAEYKHIKLLQRAGGFDGFGKYIPQIKDTLEASERRANILSYDPGYTLLEIMKLYPQGIPFRHIVWMMNRALSALAFVHSANIVHGAVLPQHLVYGPESHGLTLIDWCYSVKDGKTVPALVKDSKNYYPPEVERKLPAQPQTDIYMLAASLFLAATGTKISSRILRRFQSFFDLCLAGSPNSRPGDAIQLQDRWVKLAEEEYGKPTYLKLEIPIQ